MNPRPPDQKRFRLRILTIDPRSADPADLPGQNLEGFTALLLTGRIAPAEIAPWGDAARDRGLRLLVDSDPAVFSIDDPAVEAAPEAFEVRRRRADADRPVDPRNPGPAAGEAHARLDAESVPPAVLEAIVNRLAAYVDQGARGFRFMRPGSAAPGTWSGIIQALRTRQSDLLFIAQTPGVARPDAAALRDFDYLVSSFGSWDFRAPWLVEEYEGLRTTAPLLAEISEASARAAASPAEAARLLLGAAATGAGLVVPHQLLAEGAQALKAAGDLNNDLARYRGETRGFDAGRDVTALVRARSSDMRAADEAMLILINRSVTSPSVPDEARIAAAAGADFGPFKRRRGSQSAYLPLAPGEVRVLSARRARPIAVKRVGNAKAASAAAARPRLVLDALSPSIDGGAFPAKRTVGERVEVSANIFGDGHEQYAAELRWRATDEKEWKRTRMAELGNDRWSGTLSLDRLGRHEYVIEAWLDRYGGFRRDFRKKLDAGVAQKVDYMEGRRFVEDARKRAGGDLAKRLKAHLDRLYAAEDADTAAAALLDPELALLMDEADERLFSITSAPQPIDAERLAARFSSWYELFPRSITDDPARHGTFRDVIGRLPAVRAMGFDTLYFTPIHPIGEKHRKGRNNTLTPEAGDPGSPYAIGSKDGGHDALHPELGTFEDFRALVEAAREHGLEIAIDFAIQCSPDHPWLQEHPGWFDWRPDGTIKYAENPPKKYQDIVNVDFYKDEAIPDLWTALRDVVLFWIEKGVKTFRVDNPHTKPFPFWEWMIADVRSVHPDAIFLAEAFTRPAVMDRLAKIGFSQSYTYFTWRNTKAELTEYLTELTTTEVKEYFRPHFFVNTPDINPTFLQTSGRAGFQIRAVLAATLSGLFGVYSGFELCEADAVPGKEEYWESEKYEVKPRDWNAPGNIIEDITLLNRLRRAYPALQTHLGVTFYKAFNDNILYYAKGDPTDGELILVAVSLDPHHPQEADFEVPLWEWKLGDHESVAVEDLVGGGRFHWHGKVQHLRLTPDRPYAIWRIAPTGDAA